jgi:D-alanyl-D-alanine carboxypeptidase (penicillin-binding protein 5/6)
MMSSSISRLVVIAFVFLQAGLGVTQTADAQQAPGRLSCRACILIDDTGDTLWARRPHSPRSNASTTKMLTALTVLKLNVEATEVPVSRNAATTGGGGLDLSRGEVLTVDELLHALLMTSSNDAAVALAEHAAGSETSFVAAMNSLAFDLGARDSHFISPHGLDAPEHYSTASDLADIGAALLDHDRLARIVSTERYELSGAEGIEMLENSNPLLGAYRGTVGIKTGFTDQAGEVLVAAAQRHSRRLIAVVMGSRDAASDSRTLLNFGWDRLSRSLLLPAGKRVGEVTLSEGASAVAVAANALRGWARPEEISSRFVARHNLSTVATAGEEVGRVDIYRRGHRIASAPAVATTSLAVPKPQPAAVGRVLATLLDGAFQIASWLGVTEP